MTVTRHRPPPRFRFRESDCDVEEFAALVDQPPTSPTTRTPPGRAERAGLRRGRPARGDHGEAGREPSRPNSSGAHRRARGSSSAGRLPRPDVVDRVTAAFERDDRRRAAPPAPAAATTSPSPAPTTGSGTRWRSSPCATPRRSSTTTPTTSSRSSPRPGSARRYQVTSQVNVVRPGGEAQDPHRDYHLGFLSDEVAERYPAHVHLLSPVLTLQGAVAHSDMPVESGPTLYLPYSHRYPPGYLAWRLPEFRDHFAEHHVQLPLAKGDAAFFNPALFHGAGNNVSADVQRMANLLQVSSAFGRAMETVDRARSPRRLPRAARPPGRRPRRAGSPRRRRGGRGLPVPDEPRPRPAESTGSPRSPGRARHQALGRALGARRSPRAGRLRRRHRTDDI